MPKTPEFARMRAHARPKWAYTVEYWESRQEYHLVKYGPDELIRSLLLWWQLRRHPAFYDVKWRIEL